MFKTQHSSSELVNHETYSDAEVMLSGIEDAGRVVVKLNSANVYSITYPEVQSAAESSGQARVRGCEILRAGRRKDGDTDDVTEINFIPGSRRAN